MSGTSVRVAYAGIGNSDDKLGQREWAAFVTEVRELVKSFGIMFGEWHSQPADSWQNACFCVAVGEQREGHLKVLLRELAARYRQDSISWVTGDTEHLRPVPVVAS